jgi:hypothetical protein
VHREIPEANPPLTTEEQLAVTKLTTEDLQAIDSIILANCAENWFKVARVVIHTERALKKRYPDISYVFYAQRLCQLVEEGRLDSQGNVLWMRFSEVRLPSSERG